MTKEEELLAELLSVNEELQAVLRVYDDLVRIEQERDAEERSRHDFRMDRAVSRSNHSNDTVLILIQQLHREQLNGFGLVPPPSSTGAGSSRSPSPTPSPASSPAYTSAIPPVIPSQSHPLPPIPIASATNNRAPASVHGSPSIPSTYPHSLAPPHGPRHGPRSPMQRAPRSRSPSQERPSVDSHTQTHSRTSSSLSGPPLIPNGLGRLDMSERDRYHVEPSSDEEVRTPIKLSAKALGKRPEERPPTPESELYGSLLIRSGSYVCRSPAELLGDVDEISQYDHDQEESRPWGSPPVQYVYDAAAERTEQRIKQGHAALVSGVR
jgi:hypothetical protein